MSEEFTWTTQDGRKLKVTEMETDHIIKCIKLIESKGFIRKSVWEFYFTCTGPTGDMASYEFERELDYVFSKIPNHQLDYFYNELDNRGVKYE